MKILNWFLKKDWSPKVGQTVTICYDKLINEGTGIPYYVYTEKTARYLGEENFSFQHEGQWSPKIDLSKYPKDRYFEKRLFT